MQFAATAQLYLTDAGEDEVTGLDVVTSEYAISGSVEAKGWQMTFRAADGKTGKLILPFPPKMTTLAVDIHDGQKSGGGGPLLYKEWRFEGRAAADGFFRERALRYVLILQGRGNRCHNAEDFKNWRLELLGQKTACAFFGELGAAGGAEE